jgi:predicted ribosomally synthesized peptide with nif11-like leader
MEMENSSTPVFSESLVAFGEHVRNHPQVMDRLAAISSESEEARFAEIVRIALAEGFDVRPEELKAVLDELSSALTDEELEKVVGGGTHPSQLLSDLKELGPCSFAAAAVAASCNRTSRF